MFGTNAALSKIVVIQKLAGLTLKWTLMLYFIAWL